MSEQITRAITAYRGVEPHAIINRAAMNAALQSMRQPDPPDAEVWRCPCCNQITDRAIMAAMPK